MIRVSLTPAELMLAATTGALRQAESMLHGRREARGAGEHQDGLYKHVLGACGEIAVARVLGRYWGGDVCTFTRADIGTSVQVKMRSRHDWDLIVRPDDDDAKVFVLVTGMPTDICVHGWCYGRDAKRPEYLAPHGGRPEAYFVPQAALRAFRGRVAA